MAKVKRSANRTTYVSTTPVVSGGLTAWHVRDFVRSLDDAGVPDNARLTAHHSDSTRHFEGISVHHTEEIDGWPAGPDTDEAEANR